MTGSCVGWHVCRAGGSVCAGVRVFVCAGVRVCAGWHGTGRSGMTAQKEPQVSGSSHHKLQAAAPLR